MATMNLQTTSMYKYTPLKDPSTQTRLFQILLHDDNAPIRCRMFPTNMPLTETYCAMSYEWGPSDQIESIYISGRLLHVRRNLHHFLFQIRARCRERTGLRCAPLLLWCDAICIDQSSALEKGVQVPQMASIYGRANAVLAWLGAESDSSDFIMDCLANFTELPRYPVVIDTKLPSWPNASPASKALVAGLRARQSTDVQAALTAFVNRSYWERLWIVQEISIHKCVWVICGSKWLSPDAWHALYILTWSSLPEDITDLMGPARSKSKAADLIHDCFQNSNGYGRLPKGLDYVVRQYTDRACYDPRDHVYALIGIAAETAEGRSFPVDYNCNSSELVEDLVLFQYGQLSLETVHCLLNAWSPHVGNGQFYHGRWDWLWKCRDSESMRGYPCRIHLSLPLHIELTELLHPSLGNGQVRDWSPPFGRWYSLTGEQPQSEDVFMSILGKFGYLYATYRPLDDERYTYTGMGLCEPIASSGKVVMAYGLFKAAISEGFLNVQPQTLLRSSLHSDQELARKERSISLNFADAMLIAAVGPMEVEQIFPRKY